MRTHSEYLGRPKHPSDWRDVTSYNGCMVTRGKATDEELAYIAGFMDADGYIGMCKNSARPNRHYNPRYQAEIVVVNNHRPVLEWMQSLFGGSIQTRKRVHSHHKPTYAWKCGDVAGLALLQAVRPYLRVKLAQADVLIEFQSAKRPSARGRGSRLSAEELARYERCYQQYRALNDDRRPQRLSERAPQPPKVSESLMATFKALGIG